MLKSGNKLNLIEYMKVLCWSDSWVSLFDVSQKKERKSYKRMLWSKRLSQ